MTASRAAITIVSKNYFAYARTLATSYKLHHPGDDFIVVLVDKADGFVPARLDCGAEIVEIAAFQVPDLAQMIYRYSIMELNTAVKPFVLADLFRRRRYETLLYIDPDVWVFEPLQEVYSALERVEIVLTPHIRRPYLDDGRSMPSDVAILQSGTYNLGFLGLRRGDSSRKLLEWWMAKLYRDCVVDIPGGLFVDQKWIDLVPAFFPDHEILYHPGYNAAYWNLHERPIKFNKERWYADGQALAFFHFSGYLPHAPNRLSKHQDRHRLEELPDLKKLTDAYAEALRANGYDDSCDWPYAFEVLSNGVRLPLDLVAKAMQWASRVRLATPCPITEPTEFCRFLMSRGLVPERPRAVLLFEFLLRARPDVVDAFPGCVDDHDDASFRSWLESSGIHEHQIADLLRFENSCVEVDRVSEVFTTIRQSEVGLSRFPKLWVDPVQFNEFVRWIAGGGPEGANLGPEHARRLSAAVPGVNRILHTYFLREDLQSEFAGLGDRNVCERLSSWLMRHRHELALSVEAISLFRELASKSSELLERVCFLYQRKAGHHQPSIYSVEARGQEVGSRASIGALATWLAGDERISALDHFGMHFERDPVAEDDFSKLSVPALDAKSNYKFVTKLRSQSQRQSQTKRPVNLAGFLSAPTGMGESSRSMRTTLEHCGIPVRSVTLPHVDSDGDTLPSEAAYFGWPASNADLSIAVANADSSELLASFLPSSFWGKRRIGYWVWETEELPSRFQRSQRLVDEIWTPSGFSANAIRRTVSIPVHVLPHTVDFQAADRATADRARFALPDDAVLFGFAFDPASVLERKNLLGLVEAFNRAFRADDRCWLILKVNSVRQRSYEFNQALARIDSDRVLLIESTMSRDDTFSLLKSLDAYVSLHRAEGFGLTCAEAMACGVPVLASGYSGNLEFMSGDNSLLVPTSVIETERPHGPYPAGTCWGDPDLQVAEVAMRQLLNREYRRHLGMYGQVDVRRILSPEAIASRLAHLLDMRTESPLDRVSIS